ncbi:YcxB family protein [bacterium]|nr:YcxB family protein [bacterium]
MEELSVSYQYTKQDIANFVLDSYSFEKVRCTLFLIFNISAFTIGVIFLFMHKIPLGVLFIGVSLVAFPIVLYASYVTAKNSLKIITNVVCTLKDEGLSFMSNLGDNLIAYNDICDVKVTEELIFVYVDKNSTVIIPKRVFKSLDKALDFAALLTERYKNAILSKI